MTDPDTTPSTRRPLLIAAAFGAVVLAIALALVLRDDSSGSTDATPTSVDGAAAASTSDDGDAADSTTTSPSADRTGASGEDATSEGATDGDAAGDELAVEVSPVTGSGEVELCAAIVVRLGEYRDAFADGEADQALLDALDEFEAQVDTQSDDHDWGDRIVEQLTNVRRELVTALAAQSEGDTAGAQRHNDAAIDHLDEAIDTSGCPTP